MQLLAKPLLFVLRCHLQKCSREINQAPNLKEQMLMATPTEGCETVPKSKLNYKHVISDLTDWGWFFTNKLHLVSLGWRQNLYWSGNNRPEGTAGTISQGAPDTSSCHLSACHQRDSKTDRRTRHLRRLRHQHCGRELCPAKRSACSWHKVTWIIYSCSLQRAVIDLDLISLMNKA